MTWSFSEHPIISYVQLQESKHSPCFEKPSQGKGKTEILGVEAGPGVRQARKKCARPRTVHSMGCASLCEEENRQVPLQVPPLTTSFSLHTLLAPRVHAVPSAQEREWGPRSYTATVQSDRAGLSELQAHGRPPTQVFPSADGTTATPAELLGGGGDVCMTLIAVPGTNRHAICDCWHCTPTDTWLSMTSS